MKIAMLFPWVAMFVIASACSGIVLKMAAERTGRAAFWYFVLGNLIGVLCPLGLTFGLKHGHANLVYALCFGGGFAVLQLLSSWLFRQPLSIWQWAGIGAVALGIFLLQIRDT